MTDDEQQLLLNAQIGEREAIQEKEALRERNYALLIELRRCLAELGSYKEALHSVTAVDYKRYDESARLAEVLKRRDEELAKAKKELASAKRLAKELSRQIDRLTAPNMPMPLHLQRIKTPE